MLNVEIAGRSHEGTVRAQNEDRIDWWCSAGRDRVLALLADGMGGYAGGGQASEMAVSLGRELLVPMLSGPLPGPEEIASHLSESFLAVNSAIRTARDRQPGQSQMGTTLVAAVVAGERALVAHVGDSRCYHWTAGSFWQLTRDDTVVQNMVDDGSISLEQAGRVPFRNVLTKALGAEAQLLPTVCELNLRPGDGLLLCSDGLVGALSPEHWTRHLAGEPQAVVDGLIEAGLAAGAEDNLSVVWVITN